MVVFSGAQFGNTTPHVMGNGGGEKEEEVNLQIIWPTKSNPVTPAALRQVAVSRGRGSLWLSRGSQRRSFPFKL